jgi:hypothetical protein
LWFWVFHFSRRLTLKAAVSEKVTWRTARVALAVMMLTVPLSAAICEASDGYTYPPGPVPDAVGGLKLFAMASDGEGEAAPDSLKPPEYYHAKGSRFWRTTGEMVLFNLIMTLYGKYIMNPEDNGFDVTFKTIKENLKNGFEWDDNSFSANNFRHPYQGSLYFGGARSNGYDFYQSSMFAFAGSWLFEYMGEAHHPSINDWINTAVGGITLGEGLYRLSDMVLDNRATGSGRAWRELGGFALSPMRGLNRFITGEAFEVHANPPDRFPGDFGGSFRLGMRTLSEENLWTAASSKAFLAFDVTYDNPFEVIGGEPFDHFSFGMRINFNNRPHGIGEIVSEGMIYGKEVNRTETTHHILGAFLHFDYIDNEAYTYGGQSLSASFLSKFKATERFRALTSMHAQYILLGAAKSDYFNLSGREYDYGPGVGYKVGADFWLDRWEFLSLWHQGHWVRSVNGNRAQHYVNFTRAKIEFPIRGFIGAGVDYVLYIGDRNYRDFSDVYARNPELRLYFMWRDTVLDGD